MEKSIAKKIAFITKKLEVANGKIEKAEKANKNPRNYYSPERNRRIKELQYMVKNAQADLAELMAGNDIEINDLAYDFSAI